jgi:hypothetical protein
LLGTARRPSQFGLRSVVLDRRFDVCFEVNHDKQSS